MADTFIIYSVRAQGWVFKGGTYGTDRAQARVFTYDDAVEYCRERSSPDGGPTYIPSSISMMDSAENKS